MNIAGRDVKKFYVYLHCTPDGVPFYVGKGSPKRARQMTHRNDAHKAVVACIGHPAIYIFPCETENEAFSTEKLWIRQLRDEGVALTNISIGGAGASGAVRTKEFKEKLSAANKGKIYSPETLKRMSIAHKGRRLSIEHKEKIGKALRGRPASAIQLETLARAQALSPRMLGKRHSVETREKMSLAQRGRPGKPRSDAARAKISASLRLQVQSDETRAKRIASMKAFFARKRQDRHENSGS